MKHFLMALGACLLFNGCSQFVFAPVDEAPQTEHDKLLKRAQNALEEQQTAALNK